MELNYMELMDILLISFLETVQIRELMNMEEVLKIEVNYVYR